MKKTINSLLLCSAILCAKTQISLPTINLKNNIILETSTTDYIKSISFSKNKFLVCDKNEIQIFNNNKLSNTINFKNIKKVKFSSDTSKIIILTRDYLLILNSTNHNTIKKIEGNFNNFDEKNNILILSDYYNGITIYNLTANKIVSKINKKYIKNISISNDNQKVALAQSKKLFIYDIKSNKLLRTFENNGITQIKWNTKNRIFVTNYNNIIFEYDIKNSNIISQTSKFKSIDKIEIIDTNNILITNNNYGYIYNFKTKKIIKKYILTQNSNISDLILKNDYLGIAYYKDVYLYKLHFSKIKKEFSKKIEILPVLQTSTKPKIENKTEQIKIKSNHKPILKIITSKTTGIAPLKVDFKITAKDIDGNISNYFIDFAGHLQNGKGNFIKEFSYTFQKAGNYKLIVAIQDNDNLVATKQIVIKVKNRSFPAKAGR